MALSIFEILKTYGRIEQDALAQAFARRYMQEPYRGYAGGAARLLRQIAAGADWREASRALFGSGSYGNGAAMRAAPIGGYFLGQPERAAQEALWWTARGMGDCDTTCAIVGGIVALSAPEIPAAWLRQREALPEL
jgi:ADP-ribosylglycohydrolase